MKDYYVSIHLDGRGVPSFYVQAENPLHAQSIAAAMVQAISPKNLTFDALAANPNDPDEYAMRYILAPERIGSIAVCRRVTEDEYRRIWEPIDAAKEGAK